MQIISTELRLKDIEWVEKELEKLKKVTRGLGSISLADKAKKEEQVSSSQTTARYLLMIGNCREGS